MTLTTVKACIDGMAEMNINLINMREIVDGNYPSTLKYEAVIMEEELLDIMESYIKHITKIKELMVTP